MLARMKRHVSPKYWFVCLCSVHLPCWNNICRPFLPFPQVQRLERHKACSSWHCESLLQSWPVTVVSEPPHQAAVSSHGSSAFTWASNDMSRLPSGILGQPPIAVTQPQRRFSQLSGKRPSINIALASSMVKYRSPFSSARPKADNQPCIAAFICQVRAGSLATVHPTTSASPS